MSLDSPLWRSAQPMWLHAGDPAASFDRPTLLRFDGDDFMEQLQAVLDEGGKGLKDLIAANETWREPRVGLAAAASSAKPLKLFQPVHNRFYLVAAALVCARYSFPDKIVDAASGESAFFVLRQLRATGSGVKINLDEPASFAEMSWRPKGQSGVWTAAPPLGLAEGELRLPLFTVQYRNGKGPRRLQAGLIPVSAREAFESGRGTLPTGGPSNDPMSPLTDPRLAPLSAAVDGLQHLRGDSLAGRGKISDWRQSLYFDLLDLAEWLKDRVRGVWNQTTGPSSPQQQALLARLAQANGFLPNVTWMQALKVADSGGPDASNPNGPPPVTSMSASQLQAAILQAGVNDGVAPPATLLFTLAAAALKEVSAVPTPAPHDAAASPAFSGEILYVARCGYERPRCGESHRVIVGRPSRPFVLAQFFDPDAPFRPARIPTPVDVSLAGLRRHPKGVTVTISRQLREQMDRLQSAKLDDLDTGDIPGGGGPSFGMVCQLSIPIITICALILLMIIVQLLNIVFWWLPLFKICLPRAGAD